MPHFRRLTFLLTPGLAATLCHCSSAFTAIPPPGDVADASDGAAAMNPPVIIVVDMDAGDSTIGSGDAAIDGASEASRCTAPLSLDCNGTCVDPALPSHCGSCSNVCAGPEAGEGHATCANGACAVSCDAESSTSLDCNGSCVDPTDIAHCGSCTNTCAGPSSAKNGQAVCSPPPGGGAPTCGIKCAAGYHLCSGDCLLDTDTPSVTGDPCILTEAFGVFVAPTGNDAAGDGSRAHPYATIGHAMDKAAAGGTRRVYACATAGSFGAENLIVETSRDGVNVFGGLDCSATTNVWTYAASKKATLAPAAPGYALRVKGSVRGNTFEDIAFVSSEGQNAGDSSIAVFAASARNVVFRRSQFNASMGMSGAEGALANLPPPTAPAGNSATSDPATNISTPAPQTVNPLCPTSVGGAGGCADTPIRDGSSGQPGPPNGSISNGCMSASVGQNGGGSGPSSGADRWATFTAAGWTPMPGQDGLSGLPGQGGGGGAGPIPPMAIPNPEFCGGAGGAGGCGGAGGGGGGGGGSSIAVLIYYSAVDFESCALHSSNAGQGGSGRPGQPGQAGGAGGAAAQGSACAASGAGGKGGDGGGGGGGAGGISVGIVWQGEPTMAPTIDGNSVPVAVSLPYVWTFGTAGIGGNAGTPQAGKAGVSQPVLQLP